MKSSTLQVIAAVCQFLSAIIFIVLILNKDIGDPLRFLGLITALAFAIASIVIRYRAKRL